VKNYIRDRFNLIDNDDSLGDGDKEGILKFEIEVHFIFYVVLLVILII
jgi:hypothetical protein